MITKTKQPSPIKVDAFENKWIALDSEKNIIGAASSITKLDERLKEKGCKNVSLMKVPPFDVLLSP